jgi:hypothetical protein
MKKVASKTVCLFILGFFLAIGSGYAQKIPFQGQLLENDAPVNGTRNFIFSIAGTTWTETQSNVAVTNGLYSVVLGSVTPLPADLFNGVESRQLNITVGNLALTPLTIYPAMTSNNMSLVVDAAPNGKDLANFNLSGEGTVGKLYRALSGTSSVVNGINSGVSGYGLSNSATTNNTYGVFGRASGDGSGQHRGVYGEAVSPANSTTPQYGLYGVAQGAGTGDHFGLFATSQNAPAGRFFNAGALVTAQGVGRLNVGIRGFAFGAGDGSTGFNTGSYNNGVQGFARGNNWGNTGVYGWVYNDPATGTGVGVDNNGVVGRSEVNDGSTTINNTGVRGDAKGPGINKGVVGMASGGAQNWAGWFDGDVKVTGNLVFDGSSGVSSLAYPFVDAVTTPTGTPDLIKISYDNAEPKRMFRLENLNAANGSSTASILQKGTGLAGYFQANNDSGDAGTALYGTTNSNRGGVLAPVGVYGESTGTGSLGAAFRISNTGNSFPAVYTETNGTGPALSVNNISDETTGNVAVFSYKGTPVTRIEKDGKVFYSSAHINGDCTNQIRMYGKFENGQSHISLDGGANHIYLWGNGNIDATGTITAVTLTQTSDRTLKTNIQPLSNSLANTLKLRGVSYNWIDKSKSQKEQIGLIAQEVETVYPEFVHTNEQGIKSVNYAQLVAVLIESIKELNASIEKLQTENKTLKAELTQVEANAKKIAELEQRMQSLLTMMQSTTHQAEQKNASKPGQK